jgi:hypothetical protein
MKERVLTLLMIVFVCLTLSTWAWGVASDTPPATINHGNYETIRVTWANISSVTNSTAYFLGGTYDSASCEVIVTNASSTDRIVSLQTSMGGSQYENAMPLQTLTPTDNTTLKFEPNVGAYRYARFHIDSGTIDANSTVQPVCYFWRGDSAVLSDGGNAISIDDGGNNISIDDGGNTITTENLGLAMTTICNSAAGDWTYAPSAGKQFWIYQVKYSVDSDCGDNTRTDIECSGSTANITSDEEPMQGGSYGVTMEPNYINCGTDTAISVDHCDANNVNVCWTYIERTP